MTLIPQGGDCIPLAVPRNCEPDFSYILVDLFNMCLKESLCPDDWIVLSVFPVFKNVRKRSMT